VSRDSTHGCGGVPRHSRWSRPVPLRACVAGDSRQRSSSQWYRRTYDWRSVEYGRLAHLHSDLTLAAFEQQLGPPLYESHSRDHNWTQYLFQRRSYRVQAITASHGNTVRAFAVTTCDRSFRPTSYVLGAKVVLDQSRLADLRPRDPSVSFQYTIPADDAPFFYAVTGGSRADNFQSFALGEDAACGIDLRRFHLNLPEGMKFQGNVPLRRISKPFAKSLVTNTFAEWGPTQFFWPSKSFHIGIDEISVEALSNSSRPTR
jgi:hypothetical protein